MFKATKSCLFLSLLVILLGISPIVMASAESYLPDYVEYDYLTKTEQNIPYNKINSFSSVSDAGVSNVWFTPEYTPPKLDQNSLRTIIGDDDRVQVNPNVSPYSRILALRCGQDTNADGIADAWSVGTAFMEGPDCLDTAAHCMWSGTYGWVEEMRAYPKQNSSIYGNVYYYPLTWTCSAAYISNLN